MPTKRKTDHVRAFLDSFADVIAHRVVAQINGPERSAKAPPLRVPLWVSGDGRPRGTRPKNQDDWTPEDFLKSIGMIRQGEPEYREALEKHLKRVRAEEADTYAQTQMRKAVRTLKRLMKPLPD